MKGTLKKSSIMAATVFAGALLLSGCSGDDGKNGANGTNGTNGADGKNAAVTPIESCTVCHGTGSSYDVATVHGSSSTGDIAISNVVVTPTGDDLVVTFNAKVNGVNKTNYDTLNADYRLDSTKTRSDLTDSGTPVTLTNSGSGNYKITITAGATAYATNSRYLLRIQNASEAALASASRPAGYRAIVQFDYPAAPVTDLLGSSTSCADCHGSFGNGFHYGYPSNGGKNCTVCHDAVNTNYPRLTAMVHGIHNSANMPTGKFTLTTVNGDDSWEYAIAFPSYISNCSICHKSGAPLTAANAKAVSYDFCMTCHQNWDGFGDSTFGGLASHSSMTSASNCATCHDGATAPASVAAIHNGANITTERAGLIYNGEDFSVTEGAKISQQITGVTRTGNNLAITWTATYNGAAVNPCNATATATAPAFNYTGQNFSILKAFFQGGDLVNANNGNSSPGQPNSTSLNFTAGTGNTVCSDNVATTTIALTSAEALLTGNGRVGLQGKPQLLHTPTNTALAVRAKSPVYDFALATGAAVAARRAITDSALCLKCHVGSLYQHGGNRVDNVELCVMCHNEASSEQNVRVGMGVTASEAYDGRSGQTYGFKSMLHAVHASGVEGQKPLVIYRTRGIYAFAPSVDLLPNWPGTSTGETDKKLVYGADPAASTAMQPHNFVTAHYPRNLNDCSACHVSTFSKVPDQSKAVATTADAGVAPYDNQLDDTLQGPAAAACNSCHQSDYAKAHASQNGWVPSIFEAGRKAILEMIN